jgi:hypothetical protein
LGDTLRNSGTVGTDCNNAAVNSQRLHISATRSPKGAGKALFYWHVELVDGSSWTPCVLAQYGFNHPCGNLKGLHSSGEIFTETGDSTSKYRGESKVRWRAPESGADTVRICVTVTSVSDGRNTYNTPCYVVAYDAAQDEAV